MLCFVYTVIDCGLPPADSFYGVVNYSNTTYGSLTHYTCPGNCSSNFISCREDGNWTELNLTCYSKSFNADYKPCYDNVCALNPFFYAVCPPLESPENGTVEYHNNNLFPGSYALYSCYDDFIITYPDTRNCTCDGWSGNEPTCEGN